jgi:hypothetical protein
MLEGSMAVLTPELDEHLTEAASTWTRLQRLNERGTDSPADYMDTSDERREVESQLREALLKLGSQVVEAYVSGELKDDGGSPAKGAEASGPKPRGRAYEHDNDPVEPPRDAPPTPYDLQSLEGDEPKRPDSLPPRNRHSRGVRPSIDFRDGEESESRAVVEPSTVQVDSGASPDSKSVDELPPETTIFPDLKEELSELPQTLQGERDLEFELGTLETAADEEHREKWRALPDDVHRALLGHVVARLRRAQVAGHRIHPGQPSYPESRIAPLFRTLTRHSKIYQPGFVHGLSRNHEPRYDNWLQEARRWRTRLNDLAVKYYGGDDVEESEEPTGEDDALEALSQIDQMIEAVETSDSDTASLVELVYSYLDAGILNPDDERLVQLLDGYEDAFEADRFPALHEQMQGEPRASA